MQTQGDAEKLKAFLETYIPAQLGYLEKYAVASGGEFLGSNKISLADIAFLRLFGGPDGLGNEAGLKEQMTKYPTLVKVLANVNANEGIASHIANRPDTIF